MEEAFYEQPDFLALLDQVSPTRICFSIDRGEGCKGGTVGDASFHLIAQVERDYTTTRIESSTQGNHSQPTKPGVISGTSTGKVDLQALGHSACLSSLSHCRFTEKNMHEEPREVGDSTNGVAGAPVGAVEGNRTLQTLFSDVLELPPQLVEAYRQVSADGDLFVLHKKLHVLHEFKNHAPTVSGSVASSGRTPGNRTAWRCLGCCKVGTSSTPRRPRGANRLSPR
jgi:hypothetical protein